MEIIKIVEHNGPIKISPQEAAKLWPELMRAIEEGNFTFTDHWKPENNEQEKTEGGD